MSLEIALISNKGIGAPLARAEREALQSGCEACVVVTRDARLDAELSPASCARVAALTHSYPGFGGLELLAALLLLGDLGGSPCAQIAQREGWSLPLVDALVGGGQALELPAAQLARASAGLLAQQAKLSHALALQSDLCSSGRRGLVGDGSPEVPEI